MILCRELNKRKKKKERIYARKFQLHKKKLRLNFFFLRMCTIQGATGKNWSTGSSTQTLCRTLL